MGVCVSCWVYGSDGCVCAVSVYQCVAVKLSVCVVKHGYICVCAVCVCCVSAVSAVCEKCMVTGYVHG